MLLPGHEMGEKMCGYAEQVLVDIGAAFNHTFVLLREKIGEQSVKAYDTALTEETKEACEACKAILVGDSRCKGLEELSDGLEMALHVRACVTPQAFCGRHIAPLSLFLASVLDLDEAVFRVAFHHAFAIAQAEDLRLTHVPSTGGTADEWKAAIRVQNVSFSDVPSGMMTGEDAMTMLIEAPEKLGVLLTPPYAGGLLRAAGTALCPVPPFMRDMYLGEGCSIFAPYVSPVSGTPEDTTPLGMVLAVADLLRYALGLPHEADCVDAAVQNVLAAGWRTPDLAQAGMPRVGAQAVIELISEQISLAGSLMNGRGTLEI